MEARSAIDNYFRKYNQFDYNPQTAIWAEYHRLIRFFGWKEGSNRETKARRHFRVAIVQCFGELYGTTEDKLESLQLLLTRLDMKDIPQSVKSCKEAIGRVHVNIVDFIDAGRSGHPVPRFRSVHQLRSYTIRTGKFFPKREAKESSLLKYLLRTIIA